MHFLARKISLGEKGETTERFGELNMPEKTRKNLYWIGGRVMSSTRFFSSSLILILSSLLFFLISTIWSLLSLCVVIFKELRHSVRSLIS